MPLSEQQALFVERYIGVPITARTADAPDESANSKAALSEAQNAWANALGIALLSVVALAKKMRSDPDPLGAEIADFIRDCALQLKVPLSSLSDVAAMQDYLANSEDIEILEENNPHGRLSIKEPLLAALAHLEDAMAA